MMPKVIVITGASRGIGYKTCQKLADKGHSVIAVARSGDLLNQLAQSNEKFIHPFAVDLTDEQEVSRLADKVKNQFQQVDILINNAGALINKPFKELLITDWRAQIESNLISAVNITRQLLPFFAKDGHIVNISSMGGFQGSSKFPGLSAYSVAKGALSILTECLATELEGDRIKANALCLGAVQTDMLEAAFPGIEAPVNPAEMGTYIADFALNGSTFYNGKILPVALKDPG